MSGSLRPMPLWLMRLAIWARRHGVVRRLAIALSLGALVTGLATYVAFTEAGPGGPAPDTVLVLLNLNLVFLLMLGIVVIRRVVSLWLERRRGGAGSKLHVRMVVLFGLVAATPAIIVAGFSVVFFTYGLQAWFSDRVRTAVEESLAVAEAYEIEHRQVIERDATVISSLLWREWMVVARNPQLLERLLSNQAHARGLNETVIFDRSGNVLAQAGFSFTQGVGSLPDWVLDTADNGSVAVLMDADADKVAAVSRLFVESATYVYVSRYVDPAVVAHIERARNAVTQYQELEGKRSGFEITFTLIFVMVALLLLLASVWMGLVLSNQLVRPVMSLIDAADAVGQGNLSVRVPEHAYADELSVLTRAFNRMTSQIASQQRSLIRTNRELDERRRMIETVLAGVTAGVLGLDREGRINLCNRSACDLLDSGPSGLVGKPLAEAVPPLGALLENASSSPSARMIQEQVIRMRGGQPQVLLARLVQERNGRDVMGFILTFDDITELQAAQRKAAWADVARRIAHEIKNPLTPIQLSAERLRRRYGAQIVQDGDVFASCVDTIVRHVQQIGRLVDEFSDFARMPAPVLREEDLGTLVQEAVILQAQAYPAIHFSWTAPEQPVPWLCDGGQIRQALINLLKNSVEAIDSKSNKERPLCEISLTKTDRGVTISIEDNGDGLSLDGVEDLTQPYVTTRPDGTGLGLAIVKKIMEDHGGMLTLENAPARGARVSLHFLCDPAAEALTGPSQAA